MNEESLAKTIYVPDYGAPSCNSNPNSYGRCI